jgi:hypothetical protein
MENRFYDHPLHRPKFPIIVMGGMQEIFSLIQPLTNILATRQYEYPPGSGEMRHFKQNFLTLVYLIPTQDNPIARYIAKHDFWYQRNVYKPFTGSPIFPTA